MRTLEFATGFPYASTTVATGGGDAMSPTRAVNVVGIVAVIFAAAPALAVAVKTIGARPLTVTVTSLTPLLRPSVQVPIDVGPPADFFGAFAMVPLPADTVTETPTPEIACPFASRTTKVGELARRCPTEPV